MFSVFSYFRDREKLPSSDSLPHWPTLGLGLAEFKVKSKEFNNKGSHTEVRDCISRKQEWEQSCNLNLGAPVSTLASQETFQSPCQSLSPTIGFIQQNLDFNFIEFAINHQKLNTDKAIWKFIDLTSPIIMCVTMSRKYSHWFIYKNTFKGLLVHVLPFLELKGRSKSSFLANDLLGVKAGKCQYELWANNDHLF